MCYPQPLCFMGYNGEVLMVYLRVFMKDQKELLITWSDFVQHSQMTFAQKSAFLFEKNAVASLQSVLVYD